VGRRLGLVVVRCRQSIKNHVDRLQNGLPTLPCAGASVRLDLCPGLSAAKLKLVRGERGPPLRSFKTSSRRNRRHCQGIRVATFWDVARHHRECPFLRRRLSGTLLASALLLCRLSHRLSRALSRSTINGPPTRGIDKARLIAPRRVEATAHAATRNFPGLIRLECR
jgi:hypothetical protein